MRLQLSLGIGAYPKENMMVREYELGLVLRPDLNDEEMEAQILRIGQQIETRGGEITRLDKWGRRRMAYGIQRYREGYYAFMEFRLDSLALRDLDRVMRVQENVMRHLITWRDPRAQAERRLREQRAAAVAAAQAAAQAAQAAQVTQTVPPVEAPASEEPDSSAATETAPDAAEPATAE